MRDPDPIGQAILSSQPTSTPVSPPSAIACPHCGHWLLEPRYSLPVAAALMPASLDSLKAALRRYRNRLPEPQYRRLGARWVRLVSLTELQVLRSIQTVQLYRRAHNLRPVSGA